MRTFLAIRHTTAGLFISTGILTADVPWVGDTANWVTIGIMVVSILVFVFNEGRNP